MRKGPEQWELGGSGDRENVSGTGLQWVKGRGAEHEEFRGAVRGHDLLTG